MTVGERIRAARHEKGLTMRELALKTNTTAAAISRYELDQREPKYELLAMIAHSLDVSIDYIMTGEEPDYDYELVLDTLKSANIGIELTQFNPSGDPDKDEFYIYHSDDPEPPDERETIEFGQLLKIIKQVLQDAERNKTLYLYKRLNTELFWPNLDKHKEDSSK